MIQTILGSIIDSKEEYICHQTNCVSKNKAGGLAYTIFKKYPWADIYSKRINNDKLGTNIICGDGKDQRYVININAQYYPGAPIYEGDLKNERMVAFQQCLGALLVIPNMESIAFPARIGCGIAGGDWKQFYTMLENFEKEVAANGTIVKIYDYEGKY